MISAAAAYAVVRRRRRAGRGGLRLGRDPGLVKEASQFLLEALSSRSMIRVMGSLVHGASRVALREVERIGSVDCKLKGPVQLLLELETRL